MASWKGKRYDYGRHGHMAPDRHLGGGMAHFYRLIVAFLAVLFSAGAWAVSPTTATRYACPEKAGGYCSSAQEACESFRDERQASVAPHTYVVGRVTQTSCSLTLQFTWGGQATGHAGTMLSPVGYSTCPANSSGDGTTCTCDQGYTESSGGDSCLPIPPPSCGPESTRINGVCVPDPDCQPGYVRINGQCKKPPKCPAPGTSAGQFSSSSSSAQFTCFVGCTVSIPESDLGVPTSSGTVWYANGTYTGGECSGTGTGGTGDGSGSGDTGGGTGGGSTGDGTGGGSTGSGNTSGGSGTPAPTPTPPGSSPPAPQPQPPNPDGSCPSGTSSSGGGCFKNPEPPNADGVCPPGSSKVNGSCVYSVPGPGTGGGDPGGGGGTGEDEGSSFAGDCSMGFTCQGGDAIQCAIAKEQYVRNCKLFDDDTSAAAQLYKTATSAPPSNATDGLPGNETVNLGPSRFDTTDALGAGGSGMTDLTVVVMGSSVSLPFSRINPYLAMFGNVLVAVSLILAARIVARG